MAAQTSLTFSQINPPTVIESKYCFDKPSTLEIIKNQIRLKSCDSLNVNCDTMIVKYEKGNAIKDSIILMYKKKVENLNLITTQKDGQLLYLQKDINLLQRQNRKSRRKLFISNFTVAFSLAAIATTFIILRK